MSKLYDAALEVQSFCHRQNWRACIIGGLAVIRWGEHRTTEDVDFSLLCDLGDEDLIVLKAIAGRPQDWVDIDGVLVRQPNLDFHALEAKLTGVAEFTPDVDLVEELRRLRSKL